MKANSHSADIMKCVLINSCILIYPNQVINQSDFWSVPRDSNLLLLQNR